METKVEPDCIHGLMTPPLDIKPDLTSYERTNVEDRFEVTTPAQSDKDYRFPETSLPEPRISDTTGFSDRAEMVATLDRHMCSVPNLIKATTSVLHNSTIHNSHSPEYLLLRARESRSFLSSWYRRWRNSLFCPDTGTNDKASREEYDARLDVLGTYLSCVIVENRILTALDPFHGHEYELETQAVAARIMEMYRIASEGAKEAAFTANTVCIAQSALRSATSWCVNDIVEGGDNYPPFFKQERS